MQFILAIATLRNDLDEFALCQIQLANRSLRMIVVTSVKFYRVSVYVPESSSVLQRFASWLTGRRPELIDPTILASGGGRERKAIF